MNGSKITPLFSPYKLRALLLCHIIVALLLSSLFLPWTQKAWEVVDIAFFKWINHSLIDRPFWQLFWALANHRLADWVEDFCILGFFIAYIRQAPIGLRKKRIAHFLFMLLYVGAVI